ncbi:MAG: hypothetical protein L0Y71_02715 [Gemmataceae bacterium]|nr:hypothetical protein [Gemmataceae bacterium]
MNARLIRKNVIAAGLALALGMLGLDLTSQRANAQLLGVGDLSNTPIMSPPPRQPFVIIAHPGRAGSGGATGRPSTGGVGSRTGTTTTTRPGTNDYLEGFIRSNELPNLVYQRNQIPAYLQQIRTLDAWLTWYPTHPNRALWANDRARLVNWVNAVNQAYGRATRIRIYLNAPNLPPAPYNTRQVVLNYLGQGNNWLSHGKQFNFRSP